MATSRPQAKRSDKRQASVKDHQRNIRVWQQIGKQKLTTSRAAKNAIVTYAIQDLNVHTMNRSSRTFFGRFGERHTYFRAHQSVRTNPNARPQVALYKDARYQYSSTIELISLKS
jgi:hypothetical protein